MSGDEFGRLAYLVLLLVAVGGWFIAEGRKNLSKNLRMALVWGMIFLGIVAAYGLWGDVSRDVAPRQALSGDGVIEVPLGIDGHYYLTAEVNGSSIDFLVDTGASDIVLTKSDAERAGFSADSLSFEGFALTANGRVETAIVTLDRIELEGIVDRNIRAAVNGGDLDFSLLGMSYLDRFDSIQIRDRTLILRR